MRHGARHTESSRAGIRAGMEAARSQGRPAGRRPVTAQVEQYVMTARARGASWQQIADGLNQRLAEHGAPVPAQGASRWVRSTVRNIHLRVLRQRQGVQLELPV